MASSSCPRPLLLSTPALLRIPLSFLARTCLPPLLPLSHPPLFPCPNLPRPLPSLWHSQLFPCPSQPSSPALPSASPSLPLPESALLVPSFPCPFRTPPLFPCLNPYSHSLHALPHLPLLPNPSLVLVPSPTPLLSFPHSPPLPYPSLSSFPLPTPYRLPTSLAGADDALHAGHRANRASLRGWLGCCSGKMASDSTARERGNLWRRNVSHIMQKVGITTFPRDFGRTGFFPPSAVGRDTTCYYLEF